MEAGGNMEIPTEPLPGIEIAQSLISITASFFKELIYD